jgi:hypothetical protein
MRSRLMTSLASLLAIAALSAVATASASAHTWLKNGSPLTKSEEMTISGGVLELVAGPKATKCTGLTGKGTVKTGGSSELAEMKATGCKTGQPGCKVRTMGQPYGTVVMSGIPGLLVEREKPTHETVLAQELKRNPTSLEFMTLQFAPEPGQTCSEYGIETRINGQVAGVVRNATEEVEFANPELKGNTLEGFGVAMKLFTAYTQKLTLGGSLTAN